LTATISLRIAGCLRTRRKAPLQRLEAAPELAVDAGVEEVRVTGQGNGFVLFGKFSFVMAMPRCGFCSNQFRA
jgi:hypothetical protein